ncbi:MAG: Rho termination factor N-terminal domain-containing protein [Candidatus Izemoplasmataceae bacterium]
MTVVELKELCKERDITGYSTLKKAELIEELLK